MRIRPPVEGFKLDARRPAVRIYGSCGKLQARCGKPKAVRGFRRADDSEKARRLKRLIRMTRRADSHAAKSIVA
jgi:hypothetical protein